MRDGHCRVRRALRGIGKSSLATSEGFVQAKRRGKQVFYGTLDDRVRCVIWDMVGHVGGDTSALEKQDNERQTRRRKK